MQIFCRRMTLFEYFSRHRPVSLPISGAKRNFFSRVLWCSHRLPCGDGESMKFSSCSSPPQFRRKERYGGERNNFEIIPTLLCYSFEQVGDLKEMRPSLNLTDLVFWYFFLLLF